jgi:hypothetical protein
MPLILLPFLGSGFVPTDSMPAGLRWFAEFQPFTPIIDTQRGLVTGRDREPRGPGRRPLADLPQRSTACREWLRRPDRWKR